MKSFKDFVTEALQVTAHGVHDTLVKKGLKHHESGDGQYCGYLGNKKMGHKEAHDILVNNGYQHTKTMKSSMGKPGKLEHTNVTTYNKNAGPYQEHRMAITSTHDGKVHNVEYQHWLDRS